MAKSFNELRERLLRAGLAPRRVERYLSELADHLADLSEEEERAGRNRTDAESAALARLGGVDDLSRAMIEQRHFRSWCARAQWAVFGLAPLALLAGAYGAACLILWSGWKMFLPDARTPFVAIGGPAIFYFGIGKLIYFGAPIPIGWAIGLVAARERLKAFWPTVGLLLVALTAATARVHASRPAAPGEAGHISLDFAFGTAAQDVSFGVVHAGVILSLTALPYLIWRFQKVRALSA